ncbi:MAG: hypothetical protein ACTSRR_09780 [Candidatus Heimdallarchaeaceae archaeon]
MNDKEPKVLPVPEWVVRKSIERYRKNKLYYCSKCEKKFNYEQICFEFDETQDEQPFSYPVCPICNSYLSYILKEEEK